MLLNNPASELELALRIRALVEGQDALVKLARSFLDVNRATEQLMLGFKSVSGSVEGAAREFDFITRVALESGLAIETLGTNYLKLTASAKGTVLEGERARTLFVSTSDALMKLGADAVTTTRAFNALSQMMSKGQIYSEELKGQLAEAIPGALSIMSRALNISVQEMLNLMEQGLLTSDALVLFGNQLRTEFATGSETALTFNQVINNVTTQWTLLMKSIGDTGVWSALKGTIDLFAGSLNSLAAIAGAGVGVAFAKMAIGIRSSIAAVVDSSAANVANIATNQANAASILDKARADAQAARSAYNEAVARTASADAAVRSAVSARALAVAQRAAAAAAVDETVKLGLLRNANVAVAVAQERLIATTTVLQRVMGTLFGPVGTVVLAIGTALTFAGVFGTIGKESETATMKVDEYAEAIKKLRIEQLLSNQAELDSLETKAKARLRDAELAVKEALEIERRLALNAQYTDNQSDYQRAVIAVQKAEQERIDALNDLNSIQNKQLFTENAVASSMAEHGDSIEELRKRSFELSDEMSRANAVTREATIGYEKGEVSLADLSKAKLDEIKKTEDLMTVMKKLRDLEDQYAKAEDQIRKQAEKRIAETGLLTEGTREYAAAVDAETKSIEAKYERLNALAKETVKAKIATSELKTLTEAGAAANRDQIALLKSEAEMTANSARQREIKTKVIDLEIKATQDHINLLGSESQSIINEIALKKEQLALGTSREKEIRQEISALQSSLTLKNSEIATRYTNLTLLSRERAESVAAAETMEEGATRTVDAYIELNREIARQKEWIELLKLNGASTAEINNETEKLTNLEKKLHDQSIEAGTVYKQGLEAIGATSEEVATKVDFLTKRQVSAFGEFAKSGSLSAEQLVEKFSGILGKANTSEEFDLLKSKLEEIRESGQYSTDTLSLMFQEVNVKAAKLKEGVDPAAAALAAMGLGVPETLEAVAKQMEAQVSILTPQRVGLEKSNEAFLKYAEFSLNAAANGAQLNIESIKTEAATRGLSDAFNELEIQSRNVPETLKGTIASYERLNDISNEYLSVLKQKYDAVTQEIKSEIEVAEAKGDTAKASELKVRLIDIEIEKAKAIRDATLAQLDAEIALQNASLAALVAIENKTEAEVAQIKVIELKIEAINKERDAVIDQAEATRLSAEAQKAANESAASSQKEVNDTLDKTTTSVNNLKMAYAEFAGEVGGGIGFAGIRKYYEITNSIQQSLERANEMTEQLNAQGLTAFAAGGEGAIRVAEILADNLIKSKSYLNDAAHAAGENLKNALESARASALSLRDALQGVAEDYTQRLFELTASEIEILQAERDAAIADLKKKYELAGQSASDAYYQAKNAVMEYYEARINQEREAQKVEAENESIDAATNKMKEYTASVNEASRATENLARADMSNLVSQASTLRTEFDTLNRMI